MSIRATRYGCGRPGQDGDGRSRIRYDNRCLVSSLTLHLPPTISLAVSRTGCPAKKGSNRLVTSCHQKCIQPNPSSHRYAEGELLKGEAVCIDRCSAKFFEVNKVVGERMQAMGGAAQATGGFGR